MSWPCGDANGEVEGPTRIFDPVPELCRHSIRGFSELQQPPREARLRGAFPVLPLGCQRLAPEPAAVHKQQPTLARTSVPNRPARKLTLRA